MRPRGFNRNLNGPSSDFKVRVEAKAILEEAHLKRRLKRTKKRLDRTEAVNAGLAWLAAQPGRVCCVEGCSGTPAYHVGKLFFCFAHKTEATKQRRVVTKRYFGD